MCLMLPALVATAASCCCYCPRWLWFVALSLVLGAGSAGALWPALPHHVRGSVGELSVLGLSLGIAETTALWLVVSAISLLVCRGRREQKGVGGGCTASTAPNQQLAVLFE